MTARLIAEPQHEKDSGQSFGLGYTKTRVHTCLEDILSLASGAVHAERARATGYLFFAEIPDNI